MTIVQHDSAINISDVTKSNKARIIQCIISDHRSRYFIDPIQQPTDEEERVQDADRRQRDDKTMKAEQEDEAELVEAYYQELMSERPHETFEDAENLAKYLAAAPVQRMPHDTVMLMSGSAEDEEAHDLQFQMSKGRSRNRTRRSTSR